MQKNINISVFLVALLLFQNLAWGITTEFVSAGSQWKYLDDGSDQDTAWREISFNDASWDSGFAQLGYGEGDEATVVSYGGDPNNKHITTYFRHAFNVTDPGLYKNVVINILRDDGAVVYINGQELFRINMPVNGVITYTTPAIIPIGGPSENTFYQFQFAGVHLRQGTNVVAVEMHQANSTSSDLGFDLSLEANDNLPVNVLRGPYMQTGTPTSVIVKWRTDIPSSSRVDYGLNKDSLTASAVDSTITTEHEVALQGLTPNTKYFYTIGYTGTGSVLQGGTSDYHFITSPVIDSRQKIRAWVLGDCGTADASQSSVRDAYLNYDSTHTDMVLLLGDNAYSTGTDAEYQNAIFNMYNTTLRKSVFWPCPGNHDMISANSSTQTGAYYNIFSLPKNGEAGGLSSGTEAYYSFDYGQVHFVSLDSDDSPRNTGGSMLSWLQNDLNNTLRHWTVVYWHHPPYTKGSHDSDDSTDSGGRMKDMRENVLPILEAAGVDLVLTGHSHSYERSFLLNGHYGTSSTLLPSMIVDSGSGNTSIDSAYQKSVIGSEAGIGAVYVVAGSSGKASGVSQHPVMYSWQNTLGSVILEIEDSLLNLKFLTSTGLVTDEFSIIKSNPKMVALNPRAILSGAYDSGSGLMHDSLRSARIIPTAEPYSALGFTHYFPGGGETIDTSLLDLTGNDAIVDWVFVELRDKDDASTVVATRSAVIQRDGDIVDTDGFSALTFPGIEQDSYYVAIKHRNHLGTMTAEKFLLTYTPMTIDFSNPLINLYGAMSQQMLPGKQGLWSGNTLFDDVIKYSGLDNDRDRILTAIGGVVPTNVVLGYHNEDVNMDGVVKYSGLNNDRDIILSNIGGIVPTAVIIEQLP